MNETIETVKNMVESGLFNQARKTEDELRSMIRGVAALMPPGLASFRSSRIRLWCTGPLLLPCQYA